MIVSIWYQCAHDLFYHGPAVSLVENCPCEDFVGISFDSCVRQSSG